jgi:hypothetical protein
MTTFALDGRMILQTKSGGRVRYQAESIGLIELVFTVTLFFFGVLWGAFSLEMASRPRQTAALLARPESVELWRGSGAGRIWMRSWWHGVTGR